MYHCIPLILSQWWGGQWDCRRPAVCCLVQTQCRMWRSSEARGGSPVCSLLWSHGSRPQWQPACDSSSSLSGWRDDILPPPWRYRWRPACRVSQAYCSEKERAIMRGSTCHTPLMYQWTNDPSILVKQHGRDSSCPLAAVLNGSVKTKLETLVPRRVAVCWVARQASITDVDDKASYLPLPDASWPAKTWTMANTVFYQSTTLSTCMLIDVWLLANKLPDCLMSVLETGKLTTLTG